MSSIDLTQELSFLRSHLLRDVIPFWERFAIDPLGGISNCCDDEGNILSRDKWLWSQWRAVWVFSSLYRLLEKRPAWLRIAVNTAEFCLRHGWDKEAGGWRLTVDADGRPLRGCESIYVDGFAIYGLTALAQATGEDRYLTEARRTASSVCERMQSPHDRIPHFPYPVPAGARMHGIPMIFSYVLGDLADVSGDRELAEFSALLGDEIFRIFYRPDRDVVLECVGADGHELPPPTGTAVVPGHVIESMWFQIELASARGDMARVKECCRLMLRHVELGWDEEYGGLLLAIDADGGADVGWRFADTKLWWPHTEAMYGLLLGYHHTHDERFLDWYQRVRTYAFEHYPVASHGEWRQRLDRTGKPITDVVALPVKDPFHLPRALLLSCVLLESMAASRP